ncbi:MAG: cadmium-translocating P-type ATPase [Tissierellales bacterium]|nr:cadmium-translocating P-type ATPase [Tissierellales bacterium]
MDNKIFLLDGLDCANCAQKIESKVNEMKEVEKASLNFVSKKLHVEFKNHSTDELINRIIAIVKSIEPDVNVIEYNEEREEEKIDLGSKHNNTILKRISISLLLVICAFIFPVNEYIKTILFISSYLIAGIKVLKNSLYNITKGEIFDENFLMSVATLGAIAINQFEEAIAVMIFYEIGEYFQSKAVYRSRKSIADLMNIRPDYANVINGENIVTKNPRNVNVGDVIMIKPGEKVPLDSLVLEGLSSVDTKALTGESMPKDIKPGDKILAGFVNIHGLIKAKVEKEYKESSVSKILKLVEEASEKKAPTENFITRFAKIYTPVVVFLAIGLAVFPPLLINGATFSDWIYRALVFLVVSCPCALVISIPLGFFAGIGSASRNGILVKGGNYLEALNFVNTFIFDKTGTLTEGIFKVKDVVSTEEFDDEELIYYAAHAEYNSNHPIAKSIVDFYNGDINSSSITFFREYAGNGIMAIVDGKNIILGKIDFLRSNGIDIAEKYEKSDSIYVSIDGSFAGYISISDTVKKDAKSTIKELKRNGITNIIMLTGDNDKAAKDIALNLGIDSYYADLLPEDKVRIVEDLMMKNLNSKSKIAFIGDGINDAPVLSRSDIGIAMGGLGSDAAIEASDIVIMTDELHKLVDLLKISDKTRKVVYQNIYLALTIKFTVLILGALGVATMWQAVFADVGVTILAVINSIRILKNK